MRKKYLCLILSAMLSASAIMPVQADDAAVTVADGESVSLDGISTDKSTGAVVDLSDGGQASLSVQKDVDVHCSDKDLDQVVGIEVQADNSGKADVDVEGNIRVETDEWTSAVGVEANSAGEGAVDVQSQGVEAKSGNGSACGIRADANDASEEKFSIGADGIQATGGFAEGLSINSHGSSVEVDVEGIISASGTGEDSNAVGINAEMSDNGSFEAGVAGDIKTDGTCAAGIDLKASGQSTANVNVDGSIITNNSAATEKASGLNLDASGENSGISVRVGGDITGENVSSSAVEIRAENGATVSVVAEGTLSAGKESAIAFAGDPDKISIVIWKAEAVTDGSLVKEIVAGGERNSSKNADKLEKSIDYIIKVDTSQNIILGGTTKKTYTAPDGTVMNYDTAKEGEEVAVKLNVPDGCELKGVFLDKENQCRLEKDQQGNYFLIVPKGGGVYVNMQLVAKSASDDNDSSGESEELNQDKFWNDYFNAYYSTVDADVIRYEIPDGSDRITVKYTDIQDMLNEGAKYLVIKVSKGEYVLPIGELMPYLKDGAELTFILHKNGIDVNGNGEVVKTFSTDYNPDQNPAMLKKSVQKQLDEANRQIGSLAERNRQIEQIERFQQQNANDESSTRTLQQQVEALREALKKNNDALTNEKNALSSQLANTQKSLSEAVTARDTYTEKYENAIKGPSRLETPSRAAQLSKNNTVGNGNGGYVAQEGQVQINGGKSNARFTLAAPSTGVLNSASKQADSVGGTLLHCVTTSSPGVSFKNAVVNFTVTGVTTHDTIAVYQLQGKTWVQVLVSSITDNHVTVNLTQHGPLAFVRVAAVAAATH